MSNSTSVGGAIDRRLLVVIALLLLGYLAAAGLDWPQRGTALTNGAGHAAAEHAAGPAAAHGASAPGTPPPYVMVTPFVLMLLAIAVFPLLRFTEHWWESNLHRFYVAAALAVVTLAYYAFAHAHPIERHFLGHEVIEPSAGVSWHFPWTVLQNAIFNEYVPFIMLLFSLYTISGGIRIEGDLPAHPSTNAAFIGVGSLLASLIGTTGAAMLLIRPLLETNSERRHARHTVVFFIFAVCNCGGCLLPIGDPPLFLGYLQGVDFLWTLSLWKQWLVVNGLLLLIYYVWDRLWYFPREPRANRVVDELRVRRLTFSGLWPNAWLLLGVVLSVALLDPTKPLPGTDWYPWLFLREAVQLALVGASLLLGSAAVRQANRFNYGAIIEVAALFFGIFVCMQPALQILEVRGGELGLELPWHFFWSSGALSSVLDNAPTYLVFFKTAQALHASGVETMAGVPVDILAAISLGSVFMGAMTYIGNGPNFMVKTIADNAGVRMPSFFGYVLYSAAILLPLFLLTTWLFF